MCQIDSFRSASLSAAIKFLFGISNTAILFAYFEIGGIRRSFLESSSLSCSIYRYHAASGTEYLTLRHASYHIRQTYGGSGRENIYTSCLDRLNTTYSDFKASLFLAFWMQTGIKSDSILDTGSHCLGV